jgi:hypothetical protein
MELLRFFKIIFEGSKKGKRIKDVYITENNKKLLPFLETFQNYDRKFLLLLSLFVIYKYHPQDFRSFLEKLKENFNERKEYFQFKLLLQRPYEFIKKDIEYLLENHINVNENEIFQLFQQGKISFYTFYMLLKDKENLGFITKEKLKIIDYILQFLKVKIDDNWYSSIFVKKNIF